MNKKILGLSLLFVSFLAMFSFPFISNFIDKSTQIIVKDSPKQPWFLDDEKEDYALVYFGYVGCSTVCILSLNEITDIYKDIDKQKIDLPFYFVNINPSQSKELVQSFVKSFDKRFNGIYLNQNELENIRKAFNLLIIENKIDITHSSNLYLFKKQKNEYKLHRIYITKPYDKELLLETITSK
ncbi:SCO family protein [Arcobacter sp. YIC-464]|uniref:SCO family protein n=1 Tax=Arcobacter sp. YIC-464 TaxID=3376631 RepID=UPI003C1B7D8D